MLWSEVVQSNKEEMFRTQWDHLGTRMRDNKSYVVWYMPDGQEIWYGPYSDYHESKRVMDEIVDENVNTKYPFLKEPLKAENIDNDAAINVMGLVIQGIKTSYIAQAKTLKAHGFKIPTSKKEYRESGLSKRIFEEIGRIKDELKLLEGSTEEEDIKRIGKLLKKLEDYEKKLGGLYNNICIMEDGCYGTLALLNSGISGEEILREWKREALGYR